MASERARQIRITAALAFVGAPDGATTNERMITAINAVRPLIAADALREAAQDDDNPIPNEAITVLLNRAEAIERGEVSS